MNKKRISWLLIVALLLAWGAHRYNKANKNPKIKSSVESKLTDEWKEDYQLKIEQMRHGLYLSSVCTFKDKLLPVTEVLDNITKRKSIPPDLLPELELFNDSAQYMAMNEKIFLGKDGKLNSEEIQIDNAIKSFAKEINLKTVELGQGMITSSNPYFAKLNKSVTALVAPACALYDTYRSEKSIYPNATPTKKIDPIPDSVNEQLDKIGKQVFYEGICKLNLSANRLFTEIENAQSSIAFKAQLLDASKSAIYDLGYAGFSFKFKSLYTPAPNQMYLSSDIEELKNSLENYRYMYWSSNSKSTLEAMKTLAMKIKDLGDKGCKEVERLKSS